MKYKYYNIIPIYIILTVMPLLSILILFQVQMEDVKDQGDEELYAKLDAAYSSDEEDMEVSTINFLRPTHMLD